MNEQVYSRRVELPVEAKSAFAWHEREGALDRLIPPWEQVQVASRSDGVKDGARVELVNRLGILRLRWIAEHCDYRPPEQFRDIQLSGPFALWEHTHRFEPGPSDCATLEDEVHYRLPGGVLGRLLGNQYVRNRIDRMFKYRHDVTRADLAAHAAYQEQATMHVAVTGSSGLVGSTLVPMLTTGGHQVTRLVRRSAGEGEVQWDASAASFDAAKLDGVDAVVHLAGENIAAGRWSTEVKRRIRDSRVHGTRILCEGLAGMATPPRVLICASAIGFYGDRGDEFLDEASSAGEGFLAEVARDWEAATQPAAEAGIRVVSLRLGVVLSPRGGALEKMLTPFKLGGGGRVGSGRQYWSWISVDDAAGAFLHALMTQSLSGPVNAVAPHPVTNQEFTKTLGKVLGRPTLVPMPAFAARLALGEMADELLLASTRVTPGRLLDSGYTFRHSTLEDALRHVLGK